MFIYFDHKLFLFLNSFHHPSLNHVMQFLSGQLIWAPFIFYFVWSSLKSRGKKETYLFVLFLILTLAASDVSSSYMIKNIFNRLRPCRDLELMKQIYLFGQKCGGKYGFVSSHSANSFALITFAFRILKLKNLERYFLLILAVLVAYSRIYLGVHFPGDILAGAVVGVMWGMLFSKFLRMTYGASLDMSQS